MGRTWPNQEITRKNALLGDALLTENVGAQETIRCAECILARPTLEDEAPDFTSTEIQRCRGLSQEIVTYSLQRLLARRLLSKEEAPPTLLHSRGKRPLIYRPIARDGQSFFSPKPRPGCERDARQNILENLEPQYHAVLACIGHLTLLQQEGRAVAVNKPNVHACRGINSRTLDNIFRLFSRTGVLVETDSRRHGNERLAPRYALTELGKWLSDSALPQGGCNLPDRPPSKKPDAWVVESIQVRYPKHLHDTVLEKILTLLGRGILRVDHLAADQGQAGGPSLHNRETGQQMSFSERAASSLGYKGRLAVAYYFGLDPLLYGRRFTEAEVRRHLSIVEGVNIDSYTRVRFINPLLAELEKVDPELH